jgi:nitrite reductase (NADH) small subunit
MSHWQTICEVDALQANSGVCALVQGQQVALFYIPKTQSIFALHNYDPFAKANVLSRGIIGDINGEPIVASPLYKQHFNLKTGECLEDESVRIPTYPVRINSRQIEVAVANY